MDNEKSRQEKLDKKARNPRRTQKIAKGLWKAFESTLEGPEGVVATLRTILGEAQRTPDPIRQLGDVSRIHEAIKKLGEDRWRLKVLPVTDRPLVAAGELDYMAYMARPRRGVGKVVDVSLHSPFSEISTPTTRDKDVQTAFTYGFRDFDIGDDMLLCFPGLDWLGNDSSPRPARRAGNLVIGIPIGNVDLESLALIDIKSSKEVDTQIEPAESMG